MATITAVSSSANPSVIGGQVTYTATVRPVPDAGPATFTDGGAPITGCGAVTVSTSTGEGTHTITAAYSGDATYAARARRR